MSSRTSTVLVAFGGIAIGAWLLALNSGFFHDDAYISLRYARNLLDGDGLVWNVGERVEGYTNFLHLVLTAGFARTGLALPAAAQAVNLTAWSAIAALCAIRVAQRLRRSDEVGLGALPAAVSLALLVTAYPLVVWVWGGLEGPLVALLVAVGTLRVLRTLDRGAAVEPQGWLAAAASGLCFGLAALTRPDAAVLGAVAGVALVCGGGGGARLRLARGLGFALGVMVVIGPHLLWRHAYYGAWLPNTYYAKATGLPDELRSHGLSYVARWLRTAPFALVLAAIATPFAWRGRARAGSLYLIASVVAFLGYAARVGDHMVAFRLMAPVLPPCAWLVERGMARLLAGDAAAAPVRRRAALGAGAVVLALVAAQPWSAGKPRGYPEDAASYVGTIVGEYVEEHWPAGSLVALATAGSTPFHAPSLRFLDTLGLNEPAIARRQLDALRLPIQRLPGHAKGDGAHVLARRPDFIVVGPAHGRPASAPLFLTDLELSESPEFARHYELRTVRIGVGERAGRERYRNVAGGELEFTYYERVARDG